MSLRVLIGCATSCVALDAFLARGHDAWQCDILPADKPTNRHIQDDIRNVLGAGWDLLLVSNPPCTRLCNSGVRWLSVPPAGRTASEMWQELDEGAALFSDCLNAPIPRVAVENPVMHRHARERVRNWIKPQIVQPWWFGDPAFKATGLYLRNLPPLEPTNKLTPPRPGTDEHKRWSAIHRAPPGPDRWKFRSKTFAGMAEAWVDQWGGHALQEAALPEIAARWLDAYDASMSGTKPTEDQREISQAVGTAACFAGAAYTVAQKGGADIHALARAFMTALMDVTHPDLDYLRADPEAGQVAREASDKLRALSQGGEG